VSQRRVNNRCGRRKGCEHEKLAHFCRYFLRTESDLRPLAVSRPRSATPAFRPSTEVALGRTRRRRGVSPARGRQVRKLFGLIFDRQRSPAPLGHAPPIVTEPSRVWARRNLRRLPLLFCLAGHLEVAGRGRPVSGKGAAPPPKRKSNQSIRPERAGGSKPNNRNTADLPNPVPSPSGFHPRQIGGMI
jgi:hypothetical protein